MGRRRARGEELAAISGEKDGPKTVTYQRHYNGRLVIGFNPRPKEDSPRGEEVIAALNTLRGSAMRLSGTAEQEAEVQTIRTQLLAWADGWKAKFSGVDALKTDVATASLKTLRDESNAKANSQTATVILELQTILDGLLKRITTPSLWKRFTDVTEKQVPVFIYFDRYGVLDSAIYLPRFLDDLKTQPNNARVRTVNAMFKHVGLSAQELVDLGSE